VIGTEALPGRDEVLVEDRECQVTEQRRENPALGRAGDRVPLDALAAENPSLEERLDQAKDALIRLIAVLSG
jgi:hypothetical protein